MTNIQIQHPRITKNQVHLVVDILHAILNGWKPPHDMWNYRTGELILPAGRPISKERIQKYVESIPCVESLPKYIPEPIPLPSDQAREVAKEIRSISIRLRKLAKSIKRERDA